MRRREFITLIGGAAAAQALLGPLVARALEPDKLPTIGFLGTTSASAWTPWTAAFVDRLRELGWVDGRTVAIEYRWADGRSDRFAEIAAEFVRLKVNVIVTAGTLAAAAVKQATAGIPIVFAAAGDPVGTGLVASLARPGGNVTGLSIQQNDTAGKRLELLRDLVPNLRRLAILANVDNPAPMLEVEDVQAAARTLGLEVILLKIRRAEDIAPAIEALKGRADALYVATDPLVSTNRIQINTLALDARLPTVHGGGEYVEAGGLMSYGANFPGPVPARRRVRRQDSAWDEAGRHPGRAADQIRSRHQPENCADAWARRPADVARPRRRGNRMNHRNERRS